MTRPTFACVECGKRVQGCRDFTAGYDVAVCDLCFGGEDFVREVKVSRMKQRGARV
jgi:hypothetical protein